MGRANGPAATRPAVARLLPVAALLLLALVAACSPDTAPSQPRQSTAPASGPFVPVEFNRDDVDLAALFDKLHAEVRQQPQSSTAWGRLGMAYEINDYQQAAVDVYRRAEAQDADAFNWPYFRALLLAKAGEVEEALAALDAALGIDDGYAPAWLWRGSWLRDLGRFDDAIAAFERGRQLGAESIADAGIAQTYLRQSRAEEALALLAPLAERSRHPQIYRLLSRAHQALGDAEEARIAAARGRDAAPLEWRDPRHVEKWGFLASYGGRLVHAEQLLKSDQFKDAEDVLAPMLATYPEDEAVLANLAMAVGRSGDMERAFALVERGQKLNPAYYRFNNVLASLHFRQGDYEQALRHLRKSVEIDPVQAWPYEQMGSIMMRLERYDEALAAFDQALKYGAENPERLHYTAGMIEGARERWPEAIARFQRATTVHQAFTKAFIYLGRSLAEAQRFDEAKSVLAWAERLDTHAEDLESARVRLARLEDAAAQEREP